MNTPKILVVDDNPVNLQKAKNQFTNKNVVLFCSPLFSVAVGLLKRHKFDIVLTDLMLPGEPEGTSTDIGKDTPYGLVFSILAKNMGVPHVAILTDISHHSGPIAWAMDNLLGENEFISTFEKYDKDWLGVAEKFIGIDNLPEKEETPVPTKKTLILAGTHNGSSESLKRDLESSFNIIFVRSENIRDVPTIFIENNPDGVLLFGEISDRVGSEHSVKNIFDKLLLIKNQKQKVLVFGLLGKFSAPYNSNYRDVLCGTEKIIEEFLS